MKYLLCTRYCSKHSTCINSFIPPNNPMRYIIIENHFSVRKWRHEKVTQLRPHSYSVAESGFKPRQSSSRAWALTHYYNTVMNFLLVAKFNVISQSLFYLIFYDMELLLFKIIFLSWLSYYHFPQFSLLLL